MTEAADLVIVGARVRTLDPSTPSASALATRGGKIIAVGDRHAIAEFRGPHTEVLDGNGRVVVPGLVDAHAHPLWGARATRDADLSGARDLADALRRLQIVAATRTIGEWITAHGARREWFVPAPTGAALDAAVGGRPTFVSFLDGHGALATPAALARAGITGPRTFADASQIVCDVDGTPTGELREPSAMESVRVHIPPLAPARRRELYRAQFARMAASGLVGAHVMDDSPADLADLAALEDEGELAVRLMVYLWLQPEMDDEQIAEAISRARGSGRRWSSGAVKFFLDGVIDQGTAWLGAPDLTGHGTVPNWPDPQRYAEVVRRCVGAGLGCATHAIGDRAIRTALDVYASVRPADARQPPCRIEHVELCDPRDVARFAAHGVIASVQPTHIASVAGDPDSAWVDRLDAARRGWGWPFADLARAGAVLALGSDWPVADPDPRVGMMWARQRWAHGRTGPGYRDDQVLGAAAALEGYTRGPARAAGDALGGRIVVGARADLTLLGADPVDCAVGDLPQIPVIATIVAGAMGYRSADV